MGNKSEELLKELSSHPEYKNKLLKKKAITAASLLLTEDCNLGCRYCYEIKFHKKQTSMTPETGEKAIDFLVEGIEEAGSKEPISIMLFGGEPTLNIKTMRAVKERADYYRERKGINFNWNLITNTTIYTEELEKLLQEFMDDYGRIQVQLSVDGDEDTQNTSRVYKDGAGSYAQVLKTIPKYKELFKKNNKERDLNIHGVLDAGSIKNFYKNFLHHRVDMGISSVWFIPAHNSEWTKEHVEIYKEQLGLVSEWILKDIRETKNLNELSNYNPLNRVFDNRTSFTEKPCGAGAFYISINHKGEIYPCHQIYFSNREKNDTYSGDIFNGIDTMSMNIFNDYESSDINCPTSCKHYGCFRCVAENLSANGSLFSQVRGIYCELMLVDKYYQDLIKEEIEKMGLFEKREDGCCDGDQDCDCNNKGLVDIAESVVTKLDNRRFSSLEEQEQNISEYLYSLNRDLQSNSLWSTMETDEEKLEMLYKIGAIQPWDTERQINNPDVGKQEALNKLGSLLDALSGILEELK